MWCNKGIIRRWKPRLQNEEETNSQGQFHNGEWHLKEREKWVLLVMWRLKRGFWVTYRKGKARRQRRWSWSEGEKFGENLWRTETFCEGQGIGKIYTWKWGTKKVDGRERLRMGCVGKLAAQWFFLPWILVRFGKRGIGIWVKKCNHSRGWLITCVAAKDIDSGKNLHPNYLRIQRTIPIFSSSGMPSVWLTCFHSLVSLAVEWTKT